MKSSFSPLKKPVKGIEEKKWEDRRIKLQKQEKRGF
jgi:hypothetical protein